jgi:hypothetical protein
MLFWNQYSVFKPDFNWHTITVIRILVISTVISTTLFRSLETCPSRPCFFTSTSVYRSSSTDKNRDKQNCMWPGWHLICKKIYLKSSLDIVIESRYFFYKLCFLKCVSIWFFLFAEGIKVRKNYQIVGRFNKYILAVIIRVKRIL